MDKSIYCENDSREYSFQEGENLLSLSKRINRNSKYPILAALVDNRLKELAYSLYISKKVEFVDYTHQDGVRVYIRTLSFILQKAVRDLYPDYDLVIDYTLPNGLYADVYKDNYSINIDLSVDEIAEIKQRMQEIIDADLPIIRKKVTIDQAQEIFLNNRQIQKLEMLKQIGKYFVSIYFLEGYPDTFYGPMLHTTGGISLFDLFQYSDGFCLQAPVLIDGEMVIEKRKRQDKLSNVFKENSDWCSIIGAKNVSAINNIISAGEAKDMILISEAMHERKYVRISDMIYDKKDKVKLILISGPSSSGKTTTSKRLALHTRALGLRPRVIAMDNYFVNRENTPLDENGEYDYESLYALDLPFLNTQINDLFSGKEVEIPKFDFIEGKRYFDGEKIILEDNDILIMEGIHALNPELTKSIEQDKIFRIFASALTSLSLDENNNISTSDNRLLRRIVRDHKTRGASPEDTINRWLSVRRGERKNIFLFQENADVMFNSMLPYELSLLKYYAEPLLQRIPLISPASSEAVRLLKFLTYILPITPEEIEFIPSTSVIREFIGGGSLE